MTLITASPKPHQTKLIDRAIYDYEKYGLSMIESATGTGKTWMSFFLVYKLFKNKSATIVFSVPTKGLVSQSVLALKQLFPSSQVVVDKTSYKEVHLNKIVFLFNTRQGAQTELIRHLKNKQKIDLFVLDECHNGLSGSYTQLADAIYESIKNKIVKGALFLSATPWQLKHKLVTSLNKHTHAYSTLNAIKDGILINPEIIEYNISESFSVSNSKKYKANKSRRGAKICADNQINVKHTKSKRALTKATLEAGPQVAIKYLKLKNSNIPPIIIRVDSVANAKKQWLAAVEIFGKLGVSSELIQHDVGNDNDGPDTRRGGPIFDRRGKVNPGKQSWVKNGKALTYQELFKNGVIKIYITCRRGGEGFDFPAASILIMTFPPKSEKVHAQNIGRVLRTDGDKNIAYIFKSISIADHLVVKVNKSNMEADIKVVASGVKSKEEKAFRQATVNSRISQFLQLGERDKDNNIVLLEDDCIQLPKHSKIITGKNKEFRILCSAGPLFLKHSENNSGEAERVYKLSKILNKAPSRFNFYSKEECIFHARKNGLTNKTLYNKNYRLDDRLPSAPSTIYSDWSWRLLGGLIPNPREQVILLAKNGKPPPNIHSPLYVSYERIRRERGKEYEEILKFNPDFLYTKMDKSFLRMQNMMPKNVTFVKGQKWKGTNKKYWFKDKKNGRFFTQPMTLIRINGPWRNGRSGHPIEGTRSISRAVKNINTGKIFESVTEAADWLGVEPTTISRAIRKHGKSGGYTWNYVE